MGITHHPLHASWRVLPVVAREEILAPARDLLDAAREAEDDPAVRARIEFLADGLEHLARLRDVIAWSYADEPPAGIDVAAEVDALARKQDEWTQRHVVWGPLLRQTLARRNVRIGREDAGRPQLDGV